MACGLAPSPSTVLLLSVSVVCAWSRGTKLIARPGLNLEASFDPPLTVPRRRRRENMVLVRVWSQCEGDPRVLACFSSARFSREVALVNMLAGIPRVDRPREASNQGLKPLAPAFHSETSQPVAETMPGIQNCLANDPARCHGTSGRPLLHSHTVCPEAAVVSQPQRGRRRKV